MQNLKIVARGSRLLLQNEARRVSVRNSSVSGLLLTPREPSEVTRFDVPLQPCITPVRTLATVATAGVKHIDPVEHTNNNSRPPVKKTEVTYDELVSLIEMSSAHLYDVREPTEIQETGTILSAVNIPLTKLKAAFQLDAEQFRASFNDARPPMDDPNIIFFGLGSVKSTAAVEIAHKLGFKRARHFPGGWEEWSQQQKKS